MNVKFLLADRAARYPSKPAVIFMGESITFSELYENTLQFADGLCSREVKKGDKVAIYLPNCPEYIYSYLALFSIGAAVVPLDFMLTQGEIINFINHSDSITLIAQERKGVDFQEIRNACKNLKNITQSHELKKPNDATDISSEGDVTAKRIRPLKGDNVTEEDCAAIFYTSGSTGHPKGVLLTYGHLDNPIKCISHSLHTTDKDSYLCAGVPFSHVGGLDYMLFMLYFGSTLILMDRFHPLEALKNIEAYKPTIFCVVPAMFVAILSLKECEKFDLSSLHYPVVFGAPSSPHLLQKFHELCPNATLLNGWGMTETAAPNTYSPPDISKIHSIGPFGVDMEGKIVDEEGNSLSPGQKGELWVKGKAVMVGYYKEEALTKEVITEDGWLKTGDIAYRDKEGLFYLAGRKKEMIKVAGEIVFAPEVEDILHRHPKVKEVAVIGIAHELRGEVPKAFVVPKENEPLTAEELRAFCRGYMAHFKIPHVFEFRSQLPKTLSGKIDKSQLIETSR